MTAMGKERILDDVDLVRSALKRAHELMLSSDPGPCVGTAARNGDGYPTDPRKRTARSFCPLGALQKACHELSPEGWAVLLDRAFRLIDDACRGATGRTILELHDDDPMRSLEIMARASRGER